MSTHEAKIVQAARAWALALAQLEEAKQQIETDGEAPKSAELAIHSVADRVDALRIAERALFQLCRSASARKSVASDVGRLGEVRHVPRKDLGRDRAVAFDDIALLGVAVDQPHASYRVPAEHSGLGRIVEAAIASRNSLRDTRAMKDMAAASVLSS